ncbi:unnamed protein product [Dicrocoelium dendriticum]|nr:unnamed protein product [Dicrocoelium dendriticum]
MVQLSLNGILSPYGEQGDPSYDFSSLCYRYAQSVNKYSGDLSYVPPVLRCLPPEFAAETFRNPSVLVQPCLSAAEACLRNSLNLDAGPENRRTTAISRPNVQNGDVVMHTDARTHKASQLAHVLPPNYASLLAFKSLLVHLPNLVRKGSMHLAQFTNARQSIRDSTDCPAADAPTNRTARSVMHYSQNVTETVLSPSYCRFLSVGLCMLLWPALLSTIPAHRFVESGKRCWTEALSELPQEIREYKPLTVVPKRQKLATSDSEDELPELHSQLVTPPPSPPSPEQTEMASTSNAPIGSLKLKRERIKRRRQARIIQSATIGFKLPVSNGETLYVKVPTAVKTLYACGFQPESMLHISQ